MELAETVAAIVQRQRFRAAAIKAQIRIGNMARSLVRCGLGWRWEMPEKERTALNRRAERIVKAVQRRGDTHMASDDLDRSVADAYGPFILACKTSSAPFDSVRDSCEKDMIALARTLPCAQHVEDTVGFGYLGLAVLVGEAGDMGAYKSPAGLWKRFGVAPDGCYEMKDKQGKLCIAKPKRRRSVLYTIGDSLIKGNKDGYRSLYVERKAYELARMPDMKPIIAHRRAQRYMEKRLLKHLWQCWRGQGDGDAHLPPAARAATELEGKGPANTPKSPECPSPAPSRTRKARARGHMSHGTPSRSAAPPASEGKARE